MKEEDFLKQVIELAHLCGWLIFHARPAMTSKGWRTPVQADGAGFPDLVLVRERVIFAELKSEKGKLSDTQKVWRDAILAADGEYYTWKPSEWDDVVDKVSKVV
ncbi:MAG: VRR-NUC domain-containing protein [Dehalococcoidia bacterium]|nr:VRR-NUC domain-containing protein [Dehalococcoidia bacterium]